MLSLYYINFQEALSPRAFAQLLHRLPHSMQQQVLRFHHWDDQHRSLFGKLLLLFALQQRSLPQSVLKVIQYNSYQRPYISENLDFNISHSGGMVVCAIAEGGMRTGVDVEEEKNVDWKDYAFIWRGDEQAYFSSASGSEQITRFYQYWTQKEAVMKADGRGLNLPVKQIYLNNRTQTASVEGKCWYVRPLRLAAGYQAHVATDQMPGPLTIEQIKLTDLLTTVIQPLRSYHFAA